MTTKKQNEVIETKKGEQDENEKFFSDLNSLLEKELTEAIAATQKRYERERETYQEYQKNIDKGYPSPWLLLAGGTAITATAGLIGYLIGKKS